MGASEDRPVPWYRNLPERKTCGVQNVHRHDKLNKSGINPKYIIFNDWFGFVCVYIKREMIDTIGLLDEKYPLLYSDREYCERARDSGFYTVHTHESKIYHLLHGSQPNKLRERKWEKYTNQAEIRKLLSVCRPTTGQYQ